MQDTTPLGLTPYLTVHDAAAAIDFYAAAFGATEIARHTVPDSGKIMHARLEVFGSLLMLADDFPEYMNGRSRTPEAIGGCPITLSLQVEDAEQAWSRALAAGATMTMPLKVQFWGDLYGQLRDPFGYTWSIGQTVAAIDEEKMQRAMAGDFE